MLRVLFEARLRRRTTVKDGELSEMWEEVGRAGGWVKFDVRDERDSCRASGCA